MTTIAEMLKASWFGRTQVDREIGEPIKDAELRELKWIEGAISASESAPRNRGQSPRIRDNEIHRLTELFPY
jgi:hypothetical protein